MAKYKLFKHGDNCEAVIDKESTPVKMIPLATDNTDYQEYLEWLKIDGNEPEAAD